MIPMKNIAVVCPRVRESNRRDRMIDRGGQPENLVSAPLVLTWLAAQPSKYRAYHRLVAGE